MATIKIEIDTESGTGQDVHKSISAPKVARPIMLVSTIRLTLELRTAFESGAGQPARYFGDTDYEDLKRKIKEVNGPDRFIVTAGGVIALQAALEEATTSKFVSLVGAAPTGNVGNCYGGVTLQSFGTNSDRVDFLEQQGSTRANIGLFCNPNSAMNKLEEHNWAAIPGVNPNIIHGGSHGGRNDPNRYLEQLNGANSHGISALVISADPFFFRTRERLIKAANQWLAGDSARRICYPLTNYSNSDGTAPTRGVSLWYGPDLIKAYKSLGECAALAMGATSPIGFSDEVDSKGAF